MNTEELLENPFRILKVDSNMPSGIMVTMEFITIEETLEIAEQKLRDMFANNPRYGEIVRIYQ